MSEIIISEEFSLPVNEITPVAHEASSEGFTFVQRLLDDYASGENRFDRAGEALFVAREGPRVVGVCGLNQDPYSGDARIGRVRRMYVLPSHRAHGTGRRLLESVTDRATASFEDLVLRTNDAPAAAFYERCGFKRIEHPTDTTHGKRLEG